MQLSLLLYTFRDIYYENVALWGNQTVLDEAVTQLTRLLSLPRRCININATSKGLVAGCLTFVDANDKLVDCQTPTGTVLLKPQPLAHWRFMYSFVVPPLFFVSPFFFFFFLFTTWCIQAFWYQTTWINWVSFGVRPFAFWWSKKTAPSRSC